MTVVVNWAVFNHPRHIKLGNFAHETLGIITEPPENFYTHIKSNRERSDYLKCYAFIDYFKNAYIIKAPLDLKMKLNRRDNWLSVEGVDQEYYDAFIGNRAGDSSPNDPPMLSVYPKYVFYSDVSVEITSLPLPLIDGIKNTRLVPGRFNISKWVRPIDWTFEIEDPEKEIIVKRGDPLFMVVFDTPKNKKVVLNRVPCDNELLKVVSACTGVKAKIKNVPLQKCYEMAESYLAMWRKYLRRG